MTRTVRISLSLGECLEQSDSVGAHSDLCNVDVAVAHRDLSEILLAYCLTRSRELCDLTDARCLGCLSAGVGVNLGIEDHDVDILTGSDDVVKTAETDIVCPTVAAEDPYDFLAR